MKFGDPALPPELLVSRLRQQLADQLQVAYQQEQKAQTQRTTPSLGLMNVVTQAGSGVAA